MAGSITVTTTDLAPTGQSGVIKYSIAWTSDAGGAVNAANTFAIRFGRILQVKFVPGTGGAQPTNNYTAQLQDADGADLFAGVGSGTNLINTGPQIVCPITSPGNAQRVLVEANAAVALVIAGAGNAKTGRVDIFVGPPG